MRKILTLILACIMLLSCFSACSNKATEINAEAVFQHLLTDIQYDTDLVNAGELSSVYFTGIPASATVRLHISSTGYHADEVAMITLASQQDAQATKAAIDSHLEQIHNQFQNYIPGELPKIDSAVIWESGLYIFVVIAPDSAAVKALLDKAHTFTTSATSAPTNSNPTTMAPTTEAPTTEAPTTVAPTTTAPTEPAPTAPALTSQSGTYYIYPNGFLRVDNAAYEPYGYSPSTAAIYAGMISKVADTLAGSVNVYCLPIPTALSVTLPDDIRPRYEKSCDQGLEIEDVFSKMSTNVIGVNCHDNLMLHRDENIYFRTDYHWNGLAGYYAYESFCKVKGITPYTQEQRKVTYFDGFLGSLYYSYSNLDPMLGATPDTVVAFHPVSESATMFFVDTAGNRNDYPIVQDVTNWPSNAKYLCFAAGDQPYAEFHNPEVTDGSALVLVKESYGNVFPAFLIDHYSVIYEIDYRYWKGDIAEFALSVNAQDLLFANNMTMISSGVPIGMLGTIIPS